MEADWYSNARSQVSGKAKGRNSYSNDSVSQRIWTKVLDTRSTNIRNSLDEDLHIKMLLQSSYYAYITGSFTADGIERTVNNLRRVRCSNGPNYLSPPFPINSPLVEIFSNKLIRLYDNGILEAWARKWSTTKREEHVHAMTKVDMSNLRSAWAVCLLGITVAITILGIERFLNYRINKDRFAVVWKRHITVTVSYSYS
ncbi:uncharacterized protein [Haliotis cracherodii]|uniref:uncharacterized protein n=1 Tax=Haliotis cracherodii TaxID=6455 RepID=UPI0039E8D9CB